MREHAGIFNPDIDDYFWVRNTLGLVNLTGRQRGSNRVQLAHHTRRGWFHSLQYGLLTLKGDYRVGEETWVDESDQGLARGARLQVAVGETCMSGQRDRVARTDHHHRGFGLSGSGWNLSS